MQTFVKRSIRNIPKMATSAHQNFAKYLATDHMASDLVPLDASKLQVTRTTQPKSKLPKEKLVFGQSFTDHMLTVEFDQASGWGTPEIKPYGPLSLDPSACVFHYAFELFEGMKAYKDSQGKIRLFRPDMNMARFNKSAARICLPTVDGEELIKLISELLKLDQSFVPEGEGYSLYIRPTLIGTSSGLGVGAPDKALLYVICSPVGPYYPTGYKAISLEATDYATRAWPGGVGDKKLGANYAPCIKPQLSAAKNGHQQNLWLFGEEKFITEVGTMNVFFVFKNADTGKKELVTAPLDGTILEGVTRDSILKLARDRLDPNEWEVNERYYTAHEVAEKAENGLLVEAFGSGTAAVVAPIKNIAFNGKDYDVPLVPGEQYGEMAKTVADWIADIQYGVVDSEWSRVIN
ncbi:Mitochondrial branched-chain amino acid aminotransferase, homolog of murine ECA39 [Komagataella phaffii GS115]|uniref:Branched-chain-amino-acid aminotransferase n=2 Tax=Komagataella phaffii TaxID=460519 RepID=C4R7A4_KOMPG|nr:Mitochondrial branched-chain amino acid aminotransferase, homolog of murine ECA39 [Komagataella phaffii GS115]AOA64721.1 GQ67_04574T0 [Komagataella phaffii]AOA69433.1 GQ68_04546T0 [Komagataella phaffii GS115]CAY71479.1 Mitochondrial branched-chain amino acid aminotransferase, homolog of murine ECA39 [Komagataella phaffii GS115]